MLQRVRQQKHIARKVHDDQEEPNENCYSMAAPVLGRLAKLPEVRALHELQKLGWRAASTTDHLHDRQVVKRACYSSTSPRLAA